MKFLNAIVPLIALLLLSHCNDGGRLFKRSDYLIFGHFYGECVGEGCIEIFKLANGEVFEDTLDRYPVLDELPNPTNFVRLPNDRFQKVKFIFERFPKELFEEDAIYIGQPDAGDWGGFYVETNIGGVRRYWLIDKKKSNLPEYLHDFTNSLNDAIQELASHSP